jgi:hypothetical protein
VLMQFVWRSHLPRDIFWKSLSQSPSLNSGRIKPIAKLAR